jgi:hypothetical protein
MARSITVIPAKQISTAESGTAQSVQKLKMAAYCRVSTDQEEQLLSYENQVNYYTNYISENPLYEYAGTYADEGISGTNTKKRDEFNRMIADCRSGKIDMIITKSISRFARNTLDCLNYVRELTEMDTDFMLKTLDHIKVFEDGTLLVVFLDGTEIECKNEEE